MFSISRKERETATLFSSTVDFLPVKRDEAEYSVSPRKLDQDLQDFVDKARRGRLVEGLRLQRLSSA